MQQTEPANKKEKKTKPLRCQCMLMSPELKRCTSFFPSQSVGSTFCLQWTLVASALPLRNRPLLREEWQLSNFRGHLKRNITFSAWFQRQQNRVTAKAPPPKTCCGRQLYNPGDVRSNNLEQGLERRARSTGTITDC